MALCYLCGDAIGMDLARAAQLQDDASPRCAVCVSEPPKFVRAVAFGAYDDLRKAIDLFKFGGATALALPLGSLLAAAVRSLRAEAPSDLAVVPVPLYSRKRPFNQSTLLAESALRELKKSYPDWTLHLQPSLLKRVRRTDSQFSLTHAQRAANVHGAFAASTDAHGKDVLLIDDIYTTGATAKECTRMLLRAGARSVHVATLARARREVAVLWKPKVHAAARDAPPPLYAEPQF